MDNKTLSLRNTFLQWVQAHPIPNTYFYEKESDRFRFESDYAMGELNFYDLEMYVVEFRITDFKKDDTAFFLHFELNDLDYAKELYSEFCAGYETIRTQRDIRVLLSCTSAITTSYMAKKLNETAALLHQDYHFDAVSMNNLDEKVYDHDMLLLAPQTAQKIEELQSTYPEMPIMNIPPGLFATYDAPAVLETVRDEWKRHTDPTARKAKPRTLDDIHNDSNILTFVLLPQGKDKFAIEYRFYKKGEIVFEETVIKQNLELVNDLCDILNTIVYRYGRYDIIGITLSDIIRNGCLDLPGRIDRDFNLQKYLEEKYKVPVLIINNTTTAAYGYHAKHSDYQNIAFLSQPFGYRFGGVGLVLNGQPYEGSHHIAGEVKFTLLNEYRYDEADHKNFSLLPGETLGILEGYARAIISMTDPDIILIRCKLLPDTDILKMRLLSYIPEEYLPKLRKISDEDSTEYMQLGMMLSCIDALE